MDLSAVADSCDEPLGSVIMGGGVLIILTHC
jgi:hypothetical protein